MKERAQRKNDSRARTEISTFLKPSSVTSAPAFVIPNQVMCLTATLHWADITYSRYQIKNRLVGIGRSTPVKRDRPSVVTKRLLFMVAVFSMQGYLAHKDPPP